MKKLLLFSLLFLPVVCLAKNNPPMNTTVSYKGVNKFVSSTTTENGTYNSVNNSENAILVLGGTITINSPTVNKTGNSTGVNADFYGINAAVLAYNNSILNINGGTITTNGGYANGLFAYNTGKITATNTVIKTANNNSGGIMVTGGGTLIANNLSVTTEGNSSAAIRSDKGGGTITVNKGSYTTNGVGSPAIYSTANIIVNDATLTSTKSEGAIVEGKNSITLNNVNLVDNNTALNGQSETYKNIFLYQSTSGDASNLTASFKANNSTIKTQKGDTIFVTNTKATISLINNNISNTDGNFLRIQAGKWGNVGSNGGDVNLTLANQKISGDIIVDNLSSLNMTLKDKSEYKGAINTSNKAKKISLSLTADSKLVLTGDSYLHSLTNVDETNSNIYLNGYKLYVNNEEISANSIKVAVASKSEKEVNKKRTNDKENRQLYYIIIGSLVLLIIITFIPIIIKIKTRNNLN